MLPCAANMVGYYATTDGQVVSTKRNWADGPREITKRINHSGYPVVMLSHDEKRVFFLIHRMVAFFHLPPAPSPEHLVLHKNDDQLDNRVGNLYWGTHKDNAADRDRNGRTCRGEKLAQAVARGYTARGYPATGPKQKFSEQERKRRSDWMKTVNAKRRAA